MAANNLISKSIMLAKMNDKEKWFCTNKTCSKIHNKNYIYIPIYLPYVYITILLIMIPQLLKLVEYINGPIPYENIFYYVMIGMIYLNVAALISVVALLGLAVILSPFCYIYNKICGY